MPSCTFGLNEIIRESVECVSNSEKRKKLMDSINKRKEKLPLSYFQQALKEAGFRINEDSDEEEDDENTKKEDNQEKNESNHAEEIKEENMAKEN